MMIAFVVVPGVLDGSVNARFTASLKLQSEHPGRLQTSGDYRRLKTELKVEEIVDKKLWFQIVL